MNENGFQLAGAGWLAGSVLALIAVASEAPWAVTLIISVVCVLPAMITAVFKGVCAYQGLTSKQAIRIRELEQERDRLTDRLRLLPDPPTVGKYGERDRRRDRDGDA